MRPPPRLPLRVAVTVVAGISGFAACGLLVFAAFGAPALEDSGIGPLVAAGAGLGAFLLVALGVARRTLRRTDFDMELRRLLEEEAGKPG